MFNSMKDSIDALINDRKVAAPNNLNGTIISVPGTERVVISTTVADFITCTAIGTGPKAKERYCIVHKDQSLKYNGQYTNSDGKPISVVPKVVFDTIVGILHSTNKQITDLKRELDRAQVDRESYKMLVEGLRKNGVID